MHLGLKLFQNVYFESSEKTIEMSRISSLLCSSQKFMSITFPAHQRGFKLILSQYFFCSSSNLIESNADDDETRLKALC